jgi:hypothetical protein
MKVVSGDPDPKHVSTSYVELESHPPHGTAPFYSFDLCGLLLKMASATQRIDTGLVLKALGERIGE